MGSGISVLVIIAIIVTVFEALLAFYLIKKQNFKPSRALYMSIPTIVIIWFVAIIA
ncbi:hypothetical protein [Virgibacillus phasianinus]|uniref:hypothetical protein n=1 Tax=Virgibacillus phasianinus TaxID=2017483 RepID=UPI0012FD2CEC|nr:hypothetical protein [Virgibacillus phasianinus]